MMSSTSGGMSRSVTIHCRTGVSSSEHRIRVGCAGKLPEVTLSRAITDSCVKRGAAFHARVDKELGAGHGCGRHADLLHPHELSVACRALLHQRTQAKNRLGCHDNGLRIPF